MTRPSTSLPLATAFALLASCGQLETDAEQTGGMETARIVSAVRSGLLEPVAQGEHFAIYDLGVKEYPPATFLVQSSGRPISLGQEMLPYMDTANLWDFVRTAGVKPKDDTPSEVYLYNWIEGAQGPMVFDVGVVVEDGTKVDAASGFEIKRYPAMKFASLIYEGPFPHEPNSGWQELRWEERADEKGLVYTERLYRELYHAFDHQAKQHITEVQIEIR
ncbi:MAG: GyrI-like domain-containing protein [Gammaproteobacteria bacterium]|nr:GyrI-like domain-containing protein [Gammaproteobacteria bacterium]